MRVSAALLSVLVALILAAAQGAKKRRESTRPRRDHAASTATTTTKPETRRRQNPDAAARPQPPAPTRVATEPSGAQIKRRDSAVGTEASARPRRGSVTPAAAATPAAGSGTTSTEANARRDSTSTRQRSVRFRPGKEVSTINQNKPTRRPSSLRRPSDSSAPRKSSLRQRPSAVGDGDAPPDEPFRFDHEAQADTLLEMVKHVTEIINTDGNNLQVVFKCKKRSSTRRTGSRRTTLNSIPEDDPAKGRAGGSVKRKATSSANSAMVRSRSDTTLTAPNGPLPDRTVPSGPRRQPSRRPAGPQNGTTSSMTSSLRQQPDTPRQRPETHPPTAHTTKRPRKHTDQEKAAAGRRATGLPTIRVADADAPPAMPASPERRPRQRSGRGRGGAGGSSQPSQTVPSSSLVADEVAKQQRARQLDDSFREINRLILSEVLPEEPRLSACMLLFLFGYFADEAFSVMMNSNPKYRTTQKFIQRYEEMRSATSLHVSPWEMSCDTDFRMDERHRRPWLFNMTMRRFPAILDLLHQMLNRDVADESKWIRLRLPSNNHLANLYPWITKTKIAWTSDENDSDYDD